MSMENYKNGFPDTEGHLRSSLIIGLELAVSFS